MWFHPLWRKLFDWQLACLGCLFFFVAKKIADGRHTFFVPEALREGSSATSSSALWTSPSFARDSAPVCGRSTVFFVNRIHIVLHTFVLWTQSIWFDSSHFPPILFFSIRPYQWWAFSFWVGAKFPQAPKNLCFVFRLIWMVSPFGTTLFMYKAPLSAHDCEV